MALQRSLSIVSAAACIGTAGAFLLPWSVASIHKVTTLSSSVGSRRILIRGGAEGVNSATAAADVRMTAAQVGPDDLYIVGSGYLGTLIGQQWRAKFPSATVYAETRSTGKHAALEEMGFTPTLRGSRSEGIARCRNVVFCAAPSGNDEYAEEVGRAAADVWDNTSGAGTFVFTSSGGIYAEKDGGVVKEDSPISDQPRSAKLRSAEAACRDAGGCVIRLAGLYSVERGPHNYWLGIDELDSHPDGLINLLAYEDAAGVVVAALEKAKVGDGQDHGDNNISGKTFLAADTVPTSRLHLCEQALRHPFHAGRTVPRFPEFPEGAPGAGATKVYDSTVTRRILAWAPRYESFGEYMSRKAVEDGE